MELELENGKTIRIKPSVNRSILICYKRYIISNSSFYEKTNVEFLFKYAKNNALINKMTDIYDMLENGTLFAFIMNNSYDNFISYVMNIPELNPLLTSFGDYFIVDNTYNNRYIFNFIVIDGTDPEYQLKICCNYNNFTRFEFNGKSSEFHNSSYINNEYGNLPIKNYLMNVGKSSRK